MTGRLPPGLRIRSSSTSDLGAGDLARLLDLFHACWPGGDFDGEDAAHALGGTHWIAEEGGRLIGHTSVVPRVLEVAGVPLATGYLEAVAVHPSRQGLGIGTRLVALASEAIRERDELGALSTGAHRLYERCGWERWRGPAYVRTPEGLVRAEEEDDGIMVLRTPRSPDLRLDEPIACEWRPGDSW